MAQGTPPGLVKRSLNPIQQRPGGQAFEYTVPIPRPGPPGPVFTRLGMGVSALETLGIQWAMLRNTLTPVSCPCQTDHTTPAEHLQFGHTSSTHCSPPVSQKSPLFSLKMQIYFGPPAHIAKINRFAG
eukprot:EG_transcript_41648